MNQLDITKQRDTASSVSEHQEINKPVWLRVPEAIRLFGVRRSSLYVWIAEGKIKSRVIKAHRDSIRGIRLISADSLNAFIEQQGVR